MNIPFPAKRFARLVGRLRIAAMLGAAVSAVVFISFAGVSPRVSTAQAGDTLDKVLACGKPGTGGIAPGDDLHRINIDTTKFPDAICNDGTGAVFYVRRYSKTEDRDKWVVFLQGGGDCRSGQTCAQRWCGIETNFGANKMSASYAPEKGIRGGGILNPDTTLNNLGGWNAVFIYYCSSDLWSGTARDVRASAVAPDGRTIQYTIHFTGATIIDAVVSLLRRENKARIKYTDRDGKKVTMPDLDAASTVVFAGASGGAAGVRYNADRLHDLLRRTNSNCAGTTCPLRFFAVIDSGYPPDMSKLDFSQSVLCASASICTYDEFIRRDWDVVQRGFWGTRADQSCLERHQRDGTERECSDTTHVMHHHLTTPFFVRQDTQDQLFSKTYADLGLADPALFGKLVHEQLVNLPNLDTFSEEGSVRSGGPTLKKPGVFGAQCTGHETLANNADFFDVKVVFDGKAYSGHDVLWNWLNGKEPSVVIRPFTAPGPAPECPKSR